LHIQGELTITPITPSRFLLTSAFPSLHLAGLIIFDYLDRAGQAISDLSGWIKDGKIETTGGEMIVDTKFEDIPTTWQMLFEGGNKGKLITKLQ
jgi:NADPH-dependent curcumin reductase CurA